MKIIKWSSKKLGCHEILLDDEDFEKFGGYNWTVEKSTNGTGLYAKRKYTYALNKRKAIALHRVILGITDASIFVDHIDGNGLNNQKYNLRIATHAQNKRNIATPKNNKSGFKGVIKLTSCRGKAYKTPSYQVSISERVSGGQVTLYCKNFKHLLEAAHNYNIQARLHYGEFARLNPVTATKYHNGTMYVEEKKTPCTTPTRENDYIIELVSTFIPNRL